MKCELCNSQIARTGAPNWNPLRKRICASCEDALATCMVIETEEDQRRFLRAKKPYFMKYKDLNIFEWHKKISNFKLNAEETERLQDTIRFVISSVPESIMITT